MKKRMHYLQFAEAIYGNDPESKKLFIHQILNGWSCWSFSKPIRMEYKGQQYCYVARDEKGRGYYLNDTGGHIMVDDEHIIEIYTD